MARTPAAIFTHARVFRATNGIPRRRLQNLPQARVVFESSAIAMCLIAAVLLASPANGSDEASAVIPNPQSPAVSATAPEPAFWKSWEIGAVASDDVTVPLRGTSFSSVDPETAARVRSLAATEVKPVFRFVSRTADDAVAEFDTLISEARSGFQKEAADLFGPLPLDAKTFLENDFESFRLRWADEHPTLFVPSAVLARKWATQMDDAALLHPWRETVHTVLAEKLIHESEELPAEGGFSTFRVVSTAYRQTELSSETVARHALVKDRRELLDMPGARELLSERFPGEPSVAEFLGGLLRPNTFYEAELTELERVERAENAAVPVREYNPGDVIVKKGEVIDPGVRAALTDMETMLSALQSPAANSLNDSTTALALSSGPQSVKNDARSLLTNGFFVMIVVLLLLVGLLATVWAAYRLSKRTKQLATVLDSKATESPVVVALRDTAVQRLYSQRKHWLADQERSTDRVSAMEERVARLRPRIQVRIRAYETHIKELELMLATKRGNGNAEIEKEIERLRRERDEQIKQDPVVGNF